MNKLNQITRGALALSVVTLVAGCNFLDVSALRVKGTPDGQATDVDTISDSSPGSMQAEPIQLDSFGGYPLIEFEASSRFRVAKHEGQWWFVTPEGNAFYSTGVQGIASGGTLDSNGRSPYRDAILSKYGSIDSWVQNTLDLMQRARLNTVGDFSETELFVGRVPYVVGMHVTNLAPEITGAPRGFRGAARDFFDPSLERRLAQETRQLTQCAADAYCIGAFFDDEYSFAASFMQPTPQFEAYQFLSPRAPGKLALQAFLESRYANISEFNRIWGAEFSSFDDIQTIRPTRPDPLGRPGFYVGALGGDFDLGEGVGVTGTELASFVRATRDPFVKWRGASKEQQADRAAFRGYVAERYHSVAASALRNISPHMLNLCGRLLATTVTDEVVLAAARHCDVISINAFDFPARSISGFGPIPGVFDLWASWTGAWVPNPDEIYAKDYLFYDVEKIQALVDKPILLSSFSYRARVQGMNDFPPEAVFEILPNQVDRADRYESYMRRALKFSSVVGAHWFTHSDQPASGRFDGENSNFGLVDIEDTPYPELVERMGMIGRITYRLKSGL